MNERPPIPRFLLCLNNREYPASLEVRNVDQAAPDAVAEAKGFVRVADETGDDYLYPAAMFAPVSLPSEAAHRLAEASS